MGPHRHLDFRSRVALAAGNVCLFSGVAMSLLATDFARHHYAIFQGLLFGLPSMAIALSFWAMRSAGGRSNGQA
jgi:hypothetical protein